jgi:hypothetical protein
MLEKDTPQLTDKEKLFGRLDKIDKDMGEIKEFITLFKALADDEKKPDVPTTEVKKPPKKEEDPLEWFDAMFSP